FPIAVALLVSTVQRYHMSSLWSASFVTLLPVILLASDRVKITRPRAIIVLAAAIVFPLAAIMISPVVALAVHLKGPSNGSAHYRLLAEAVETEWHRDNDAKLRFVGGDIELVKGVI